MLFEKDTKKGLVIDPGEDLNLILEKIISQQIQIEREIRIQLIKILTILKIVLEFHPQRRTGEHLRKVRISTDFIIVY